MSGKFRAMQWPPRLAKGALDNVAAKAFKFQRTAFLRLLEVDRALVPVDPEEKLPADVDSRVKSDIEQVADNLIAKHSSSLPDCKRAPGHLQLTALAMAAQRTLLQEARGRDADNYLTTSQLKVRSVVADALGVVAPPDGTAPVAVPVQWVPNRIALTLTGALWLPSRRQSMTERMMNNFEADLGAGFEIEALDPPPSRRLTRCFYRDVLAREGDDVQVLGPVFTALHGVVWAGVPRFEFDAEEDGTCTFRFSFDS